MELNTCQTVEDIWCFHIHILSFFGEISINIIVNMMGVVYDVTTA